MTSVCGRNRMHHGQYLIALQLYVRPAASDDQYPSLVVSLIMQRLHYTTMSLTGLPEYQRRRQTNLSDKSVPTYHTTRATAHWLLSR